MTDTQLRRMMNASAEMVGVGPPPLADIAAEAGRRRSRRRRTLAAACLAAGLGFTAVGVGLTQGEDPGAAPAQGGDQRLDLPTSEWRPGNGGDGAGIAGVLRVDDEGCVYLGNVEPRYPLRQQVLWPADWSAALVHGTLVLFDENGTTVAREGDHVSTGGGYSEGSPQQPCASGDSVAYVQSSVEVVGRVDAVRTELDLPTNDWEPGDGGRHALIKGEIFVDFDGCVRLGSPLRPDQAVTPVWPRGFSAIVEDDRLTLYAPGGAPIARDGDTLSMGGGYGYPSNDSDLPCLPTQGQVANVESEVTVAVPQR